MANIKYNTLKSNHSNTSNSLKLSNKKPKLKLNSFIIKQLSKNRLLMYIIIAVIIIIFSYSIVLSIISSSNLHIFNIDSVAVNSISIYSQQEPISYNESTNLKISSAYYVNNDIIIEMFSDNSNIKFESSQLILNISSPDNLHYINYSPVDPPYISDYSEKNNTKNNLKISLMYHLTESHPNYIYTLSILDTDNSIIAKVVLNSINDYNPTV